MPVFLLMTIMLRVPFSSIFNIMHFHVVVGTVLGAKCNDIIHLIQIKYEHLLNIL